MAQERTHLAKKKLSYVINNYKNLPYSIATAAMYGKAISQLYHVNPNDGTTLGRPKKIVAMSDISDFPGLAQILQKTEDEIVEVYEKALFRGMLRIIYLMRI